MRLPPDRAQAVNSIVESIAETATPGFSEADLQRLRSVTRLTVDFRLYLDTVNIADPDKNDVIYACESIYSGIESFITISHSYRILVGATTSELHWDLTSLQSFREKFISLYQDFLSEGPFEERCRRLLDMFKLQIVFMGMLFD